MKKIHIFLLLTNPFLSSTQKTKVPQKQIKVKPVAPQVPQLPYFNLNKLNDYKFSTKKEFLEKQYWAYIHNYHRYVLAWQKYQTDLKIYDSKLIPVPMQKEQYYCWDILNS